MPIGYVYILECSDGSYYTGSTVDIEQRLNEHNDGKGANHTKKRLPVELVYLEEFQRIDDAFNREKQIQGWRRAKKEALIKNKLETLKNLSECKNDSHYRLWLRLRSATENRLRSATENQLSNKNSKTFRSNGKLLITAEYAVMDGAKALAMPTKYGQSLTIEENNLNNTIVWKSYNELGEVWFEDEFSYEEIATSQSIETRNDISVRLIQILKAVQELNPKFLSNNQGYNITTRQDFNRKWGLGTSSTLINNIANWAEVDAYELLDKTFGGSGYDIACAQNNTPITYRLINSGKRAVDIVEFDPDFKNHLYFVYLNQKQNSRDGIKAYKKLGKVDTRIINRINTITDSIIECESLSNFEALIVEHENIISGLIQQKTIKSRLFSDYEGEIKSLGAWGGDFVLATSEDNPTDYFKSKGYETVIPYNKMIAH